MGEKIRAHRERAGLTQADLARALGVDPSSVSLWESNKTEPTLHNLRRIADVLGCKPSDLL